MIVERPRLQGVSKVRRALGAALTDGFFRGASSSFKRLPISHPALHGVEVVRDIPYQGGGATSHLLDIYRPKNATGPLPVVFYIHGGGFRILSKDSHWVFGLMFARKGYLVASINYRLAPQHPYPAAIEDTFAAWRWVVANIAQHGGDPARLIVAGESAGANLSTSLAVATAYRRPEPHAREVFELGVVPRAVMPACGLLQVTDPERFGLKVGGFLHDRISETTDAYLHGARVDSEHGLDLADPLVVLERGLQPDRPLPPFFAPVGTWDVLIEDTRRLERALQRLQVPIEARYYPRGVHAFHGFVFTPQAIACWRHAFAFLRRQQL